MSAHGFHIARVGTGVTDLELGRKFYEALGFEASPRFDLGTAIADQSETPGSPLVIQIVRRNGFHLELVQHGGQRPPGRPPARRPLNQLGLAYLALDVDDVERVADLIVASGGTTQRHASGPPGDELFCTDPFGARILLVGPRSPLRSGGSPASSAIEVAHVGASVADLESSAAFYRALGFEVGDECVMPSSFAARAELDGLAVTSRLVTLGVYRLRLVQWGAARNPGPQVRLPLNRTGDLIHFGTGCDDFGAMLRVVTDAGGTIVEQTRAQFPPPELSMTWSGDPHGWVFVLDPNGVQIEIVGPRSGRFT